MGKQAQNVGKGDGRLYKSVHAGRLAATHPVAGRLLADRQALIDWHNDIAQRLFRPNPLVPDEVSMQRRAKDVSKGSPWFSGYAQNFACAVGTKMSHVEDQLKQRIARRLANCAEPSPERRIPKRDVGKPQVPSRKYVHVPMDAEGLVTADDFAAVAALAGRSSSESGDDGDDEVAESKGKRGPKPWLKLCAAAREAMLAAERNLAEGASQDEREAALAAIARKVIEGHGFNVVQAAIVANICLRAFQAYSCPSFAKAGPNGTDRFVLRLELDARGYADMDMRDSNRSHPPAWH